MMITITIKNEEALGLSNELNFQFAKVAETKFEKEAYWELIKFVGPKVTTKDLINKTGYLIGMYKTCYEINKYKEDKIKLIYFKKVYDILKDEFGFKICAHKLYLKDED